jgi:hypothetical protein
MKESEEEEEEEEEEVYVPKVESRSCSSTCW